MVVFCVSVSWPDTFDLVFKSFCTPTQSQLDAHSQAISSSQERCATHILNQSSKFAVSSMPWTGCYEVNSGNMASAQLTWK
ncbi:hypothetical protein CY34DRAFT_375697 [Suillus luteus UH-Slu-Lm8-n1]|uniref:Uncharacterized protein n=1 Tax=Suillus luteus UH-Slu-Lm8-n1 TaxID=930992 RepID=A0A0D0AA70_9AGAM|nr:hypothetical protein CY34DRAFT_375697 [Suillus luteus UH-Slu-Lm8-n1]